MKKIYILLIALAMLFAFSVSAKALLIDRGGGLIYDTDFDITWLQDANYAQTSGYDDNGLMSWDNAMTWVNSLVYQGYSDWRLPETLQPDATCDKQYNISGISVSQGFNCTGSEMGHLYYIELGNTKWGPLTNTGSFVNLESDVYWSSTDYAPNPSLVKWAFAFNNGNQFQNVGYTIENYALAVRDGDSKPIPEPGTLLLLGSGLAGLAWMRRKLKVK